MSKKKVLIIDAQGGGLGKLIIQTIKKADLDVEIIGTGTNSIASRTLLLAGADSVATGENAIKKACKSADFIVGPIGVVIADSLLGEITPKISKAVGKSKAQRILIPFKSCDNIIVGVNNNVSMNTLVCNVVDELKQRL